MNDPILRELWAVKDGLAEKYRHDLRRLFKRLRSIEKERSPSVVNRMARGRQAGVAT